MKKLMLLGGLRYLLPVIEAAHKQGYYVITCDYLPDNIAHRYSDEYLNISILDKDAVLQAAREHEIDGILSFAVDPGVVTAAYVADRMGLPAPGPYDSVCILQNKNRFRAFLTEHGFRVPVAKGYKSTEEALKDVSLFHWPVIVKPTDSAGSKGVTRVDDPSDLPGSISYALSFSHCGEFIIEDFIEKKGASSDCDSFSVDGTLRVLTFNAQRFDEHASNPYTPAGFTWPCTFSAESQHQLRSELNRLLKLLDMKTSIYNIEAREDRDGHPYIMEVSPRGGGNRLAEMVRYATGTDMITAIVRAAMGDDPGILEEKPQNCFWAEVILHSDRAGRFDSLEIDDRLKGCVREEDLWVRPGDEVHDFSAANETIGTLVLRFEDPAFMEEVMSNVSRFIQVHVK